MSRADDKSVLESGPCGSVGYATRSNGDQAARDWLEQQDVSVRASFGVLFKRLAQNGQILNVQQFRHLDDGIFEFKRGSHRLFCYRDGNRYWLTHHAKKQQQKCPPREIARAKAIRSEHQTLLKRRTSK